MSKSFIFTSTMKKIFVAIVMLAILWFSWLYAQNSAGIECSADQLRNGQCKFNIYDTLGIKQNSADASSPWLLFQDIVLSMTFFIGTLVTIVIIIAWLMFIWSGFSGDTGLQDRARKWLIGGFVGMLLVMSSYVIIRLVQFLVRGG